MSHNDHDNCCEVGKELPITKTSAILKCETLREPEPISDGDSGGATIAFTTNGHESADENESVERVKPENPQDDSLSSPGSKRQITIHQDESTTNNHESTMFENESTEQVKHEESQDDSLSSPVSKRRKEEKLGHQASTVNDPQRFDPEVEAIVKEATETKRITRSHQFPTKSFGENIVEALRELGPEFELEKLQLKNCNISTDLLQILINGAQSTSTLIRRLDLSGNKNLDMNLVKKFVHIFSSEELNLSATDPDEKLRILEDIKIKVLKLRNNTFEDETIATTLARLLDNGLEQLVLDDCKISNQLLEKLAKTMKKPSTLKHLDLSRIKLRKEDIEAVSKIVNKTNGMETLLLTNCGLCEELLMLLEELTSQKIDDLAIGYNPEIARTGVEAIAKVSKKLDCQVLDISNNNLTRRHIENLLAAERPTEVKTLFLCENSFADFSKIARLVALWGIDTLNMTECRMDADDVKNFTEALGQHKLEYLDLSHSNEIIVDEEKKEALKVLAQKARKMLYRRDQLEWRESD